MIPTGRLTVAPGNARWLELVLEFLDVLEGPGLAKLRDEELVDVAIPLERLALDDRTPEEVAGLLDGASDRLTVAVVELDHRAELAVYRITSRKAPA